MEAKAETITDTLPRREYDLAEGWTFELNSREEQAFILVRIPHDWAVDTAFDRDMKEGASQDLTKKEMKT